MGEYATAQQDKRHYITLGRYPVYSAIVRCGVEKEQAGSRARRPFRAQALAQPRQQQRGGHVPCYAQQMKIARIVPPEHIAHPDDKLVERPPRGMVFVGGE